MSDDFVMDMGDVKEGGFEVAAPGWYRLLISSYSEDIQGNEVVVKRDDGKLPQGTKGTSWEFQIVDDDDNEGKKVWTTYWHHPSTASFWKTLYRASGSFSDEELDGTAGKMDILGERDRAVGQEVWGRLGVKTYNGKESNDIKELKHLDQRADPNAEGEESVAGMFD